MSSVVPSNASTPAIVDDDDLTGLEDVEATDLVMPRLTINHDRGVFVDSLSGEEHEQLTVIMLGLVRGRILWPAEMGEEGAPPLCRSGDFHTGRPGDDFPWSAAGFSAADAEEDEFGTKLPCTACALKDWGSHPNRDIQWCAEQHTYPLLIPTGGALAPALFTAQRSGIKPSRAYLSNFARSKTPLYTVFTHLSLAGNRRGKVNYYVPKFVKGGPTETEEWGEFAHTYRSIRDFLQTPRPRDDSDSSSAPATSTSSSSASSGSGAARPSASPPADSALEDDDDLPF